MAFPNPTINPPRLPSPHEYTSQSRSPTRSARDYSDPLLRDLSPTKTLCMFNAEANTAGKSDEELVNSIRNASSSEKAFGIRVAETCQDLRAWCGEIEEWEWPGTFDVPPPAERAEKRRRMLQAALPHGGLARESTEQNGGFWGSLPRQIIELHEARIEDMREALEDLDVEELKEHVLRAHMRPSSTHYTGLADHINSEPRQLNDFTALITATILQALPYLARMAKLLNVWSVRLTILRKAPGFFTQLSAAQDWLDNDKTHGDHGLDRRTSDTSIRTRHGNVRRELETKVAKLGQYLDSMLDELEGHEETLPNSWIDDFETLESNYVEWTVRSERKITEYEWSQARQSVYIDPSEAAAAMNALGITTSSFSHTIAELPMPFSEGPGPVKTRSEEVESPILGHTSFNAQYDNKSMLSLETIVPSRQATPLQEDADHSTFVDSVIAESQDLAQTPQLLDINGDNTPKEQISSAQDVGSDSADELTTPLGETAHQPSSRHISPVRQRPRHVPIKLDYKGPGATSGASSSTPEHRATSENFSRQVTNELTPGSASPASVNMRRAALMKGSFERKKSLQKIKSPVRSFEHASQAFTKLFPQTEAPSHSRSGSNSSITSVRSIVSRHTSINNRRAANESRTLPISRPVYDDNKYMIGADSLERGPPVMGSFNPTNRQSESNRKDSESSIEKNMEVPDTELTSPTSGKGPRKSGEDRKRLHMHRYDSPFTSPEFADNWPLTLVPHEMLIPQDEIRSPEQVLKSDFFERMFVDSLPDSPNNIAPSMEKENIRVGGPYSPRAKTQPVGAKEPSVIDRMLDSPFNDRSGGSLHTVGMVPARAIPRYIDLADSRTPPKPSKSEATSPGSFKSNLSTPEVRDASAAGYFRSKAVQTPALSRNASTATRTSPLDTKVSPLEAQDHVRGREGKESPVSRSAKPRMYLPSADVVERSSSEFDETTMAHQQGDTPKRASLTSIELFARAELKTLDLQRSTSVRSTDGHTEAPQPSSSHVRSRSDGFRPQVLQGTPAKQTAPFLTLAHRGDTDRSIEGRALGASKPSPLQLKVAKHRQLPDTPASGSKKSKAPMTPITHATSRSIDGVDNFDRHVSDVLERLPGRIRFTSAQIAASEGTPTSAATKKSGPRYSMIPTRSPRPGTGLTLTPAFAGEGTPKRSAADPDIKLYHLSQPGKEQPIKLFVRLVGEDERVMVRVGGGWADLGEYLRQYADHHGRRTASGGNLEIQGSTLGNMRVGGPKTRTPLSRPGSVMDSPNPDGAFGSRRPSFGMPQSPDLGSSSPISPVLGSPTPNYTYRPAQAASHIHSNIPRPSTGADESRPSSRESWMGEDVGLGLGLAGPATRRGGDFVKQKARWVEDMIEQAKVASAEKKKSDEKNWTDVGRVGATRRVVFRAGHGKGADGAA